MFDDKKPSSIVPVSGDTALVRRLVHEFDFLGQSGAEYGAYSVDGKPLVETSTYRLVVVKLPSGQYALAMISATPGYNFLVEKQMHIIATLQTLAQELDDSVEKPKPTYGALFPTLVDEMDTREEAPRTGVVMGYHPAILSYKQLAPTSVALNGSRVDLQTCVWILGKTLKLLEFVHSVGFAVNYLDETNLMLETTLHGVFVLNWSEAIEEAGWEDQKADIVNLAKLVWRAAGGSGTTNPPFDEGVMSKAGYDEFVERLKRLMSGDTKSAGEEMAELYPMADRIWDRLPDVGGYNPDGKKRPFHAWATYPIVTA